MESVDKFTQSLIDQYVASSDRNEEFESSMMTTLFQDQKYDLILYALEKGFILTQAIKEQMISSADLQLYQYLDRIPVKLDPVDASIPDTLQWSLSKGVELETDHFDLILDLNRNDPMHAIRQDRLDTLQWLLSKGVELQLSHFRLMAINGRLHFLQALLDRMPEPKKLRKSAIAGGNLPLLEWLSSKCQFNDPWYYTIAFEYKQFEVMKWLKARECPFDEWTFTNAVEYKVGIDILRWLLENGCTELEDNQYYILVKFNNWEELKLLREYNIVGLEHICECLVEQKRLEDLKMVIEDGYPYDLIELRRLAQDPAIKAYLDIL